ncbi:YuzF family protein [Paenibacillus sp. MER TA 81-3]|nr:DUF2642 domain-containing protein [Paenibacillus profundus]MCM3339547.1 YuzF family protein [Paenibacillus sp. MER TA 81-3]
MTHYVRSSNYGPQAVSGYPYPDHGCCPKPMPMTMPMVKPAAMKKPKPCLPPMPSANVTNVRPKFMEHLMEHLGEHITVVTKCGKLEGKLCDVCIDHLALMTHGSHSKKAHVLYDQICYFM